MRILIFVTILLGGCAWNPYARIAVGSEVVDSSYKDFVRQDCTVKALLEGGIRRGNVFIQYSHRSNYDCAGTEVIDNFEYAEPADNTVYIGYEFK